MHEHLLAERPGCACSWATDFSGCGSAAPSSLRQPWHIPCPYPHHRNSCRPRSPPSWRRCRCSRARTRAARMPRRAFGSGRKKPLKEANNNLVPSGGERKRAAFSGRLVNIDIHGRRSRRGLTSSTRSSVRSGAPAAGTGTSGTRPSGRHEPRDPRGSREPPGSAATGAGPP
jgi:hypothetical protein